MGHLQDLVHVGYGTMNGSDGKPFKTRAGGVMRLRHLMDELSQSAFERLKENGFLSDKKKKKMAPIVGYGALKFADLQHDPLQDYVFDPQKFLRFEGKTGPYLQYVCVRIRSIFEKNKLTVSDYTPTPINLTELQERSLLMCLLSFTAAHERAVSIMKPSVIADYAFDLASRYNQFYTHCKISGMPSRIQESRLSLSYWTYQTLVATLDMLGIDVPEIM